MQHVIEDMCDCGDLESGFVSWSGSGIEVVLACGFEYETQDGLFLKIEPKEIVLD